MTRARPGRHLSHVFRGAVLVIAGACVAAAAGVSPQVDLDRARPSADAMAPVAGVRQADAGRGCHETADRTRPSIIPFRERDSLPASVVRASTAHLDVVAGASVGVVAPGRRFTLTFDVTPARGMHVYAPGGHGYRVIAFCVEAPPWLTVHPAVYPPAEIYHFVPLDERVETYQRPFTLRQDVTIPATPQARTLLAGRTSIVVGGGLEYQACDDTVCYPPASVPIAFTLAVTPL